MPTEEIFNMLRLAKFGAPPLLAPLDALITFTVFAEPDFYFCNVTGEFGTLEGFETAEDGEVTLPGAPFANDQDFILAMQNWLNANSNPDSAISIVPQGGGGNRLDIKADREILNIRNSLPNEFVMDACVLGPGQDATINIQANQGAFVRVSIDNGNSGTIDFSTPFQVNTGNNDFTISLLDFGPLDGSRVYAEISEDGVNVTASTYFFFPDTLSFAVLDTSNLQAVSTSLQGSFDSNTPYFSIQILDQNGASLSTPIILDPALDVYSNLLINIDEKGVLVGENFGVSIQAAYNHPIDSSPYSGVLIPEQVLFRSYYST